MAATSALEARITTKELRRSAENHVTLIGSHLSSVNEVVYILVIVIPVTQSCSLLVEETTYTSVCGSITACIPVWSHRCFSGFLRNQC